MNKQRGGKALLAMTVVLAASLAHAQPAVDKPGTAHRAVTEHVLKSHPVAHVPAAIVATPAVFPAAHAAVMPVGERNGPIKGWVLLLMGGFLIATISQRRYQALSDI